jgi:nuclear pore complex protein Nup98-Nup96
LDYANAMERLPALRQSLADASDAVPDAAEADEVNELCRSVPKLLTLLPEVLYNRDQDSRHAAALADMSASLVLKLDSVRPLALVSITYLTTSTSS